MTDHYLHQELGPIAIEPLQPTERKLIGAIFFLGLALLGGLFFLQRCFPLAG
ncbi:hypothetical protein ACIPEN_07605 [Herbaspirillum chlorophenolicum]|uniref:Uncharacterized protein n=1 Tax=Herbaspirillum chlorophenolicum TaxID=211589 RepID=A0ABW8EW52_9BURK|nr:hypothetical protein [Herbaspirillum chlorophenolicum]